MKIFKNTLAAVAGVSFLIAQPAAAAASVERASTSLSTAEAQSEGLPVAVIFGVLLGLLVLAEVTGVIDVIGEDDPASP
jgi:hypothetical protein